MWACFLFPFQNEYDGYMLKQIVFGLFYHPFQDGYKSSVIQILFSWLVQGEYLNHLLQYFLYAKTITKCWCSVGMFFDRCTNFKFINWYPDMTIWILVQCIVLSYRRAFLESTKISASEELNALEVAPAQFMALRILGRKGEIQIMQFWKLSGKCHCLLRFCTRNWSETYKSNHMEENWTYAQTATPSDVIPFTPLGPVSLELSTNLHLLHCLLSLLHEYNDYVSNFR